MPRTLRWTLILPAVVGAVIVAAGVAGDATSARSVRLRTLAAVEEQAMLEQAFARVGERHDRLVRDALDALVEPRPEFRLATLGPAAEQYPSELMRQLALLEGQTDALDAPRWKPRLATVQPRVAVELEAVRALVAPVAEALADLLEASAAEDPEAQSLALLELSRADTSFRGRLAQAQGLLLDALREDVTSLMVADPPQRITTLALVAFTLAGMLIAIWRRGTTLSHFLVEPSSAHARSTDEHDLAGRWSALEHHAANAETEAVRRSVDLERAAQTGRRSEHELALLRLYTDHLVNSLRSGVLVTDAAGVVTSANRTAQRLLELGEADVGRHVLELEIGRALLAHADGLREALAAAVADRAGLHYEGVAFAHPTGDKLLDVALVPYLDESGAARGLVWLLDDVTDTVRTKNQLLAAERLAAVGRLSAQVAHEVRNPLSAIGLNAELLEEDFARDLPEPRRTEALRLLRAIGAEVERLTQVTEGYLQMARLPRPQTRPVELNAVVTDLLTMLSTELRTSSIEATTSLASPSPRVPADPGQLRQALLNVVRNAREALPRGGRINVATRTSGERACIEVTDTGPGMPASTASRVFEPFFTTKPSGTGLGLPVTQQILQDHGGDVEVSSAPERGTMVRLWLPLRSATPASADTKSSDDPRAVDDVTP